MVSFFTRKLHEKDDVSDVEKHLLEDNSQKNIESEVNPTEFPQKLMYWLSNFFALLALLGTILVWMQFTKDVPDGSICKLTENKQIELLHITVLVFVHYLIMGVPIYYANVTRKEQEEKANEVKRLSLRHFSLLYPFAIVQIFVAAVNSDRYPWLALTTPVLIVLQFIIALIPGKYHLHLDGHFPIDKDQEKLVKIKFYEERKGEKKYLSVKESRAFRIVVENVGDKIISRIWITRLFNRDNYNFSSKLQFKANFDLEQPLLPGKSIVIIPETHTEEGAIKALGYRSFGPDKTRHVKTSVSFPDPENEASSLSVEYNETYGLEEEVRAFIEDRD